MSERIYYVFCEDNCRFESMTKEQILAAITQAVESGEIHDVDTGFVTKIKEQNNGAELTFWVGTQAQYNALDEKEQNCFYIITDDTSFDDMQSAITNLSQQYSNMFAIDVSNEIELSVTQPTPFGGHNRLEVSSKKYEYLPNAGLVFYRLALVVRTSTLSSNIILKHTGRYKPADNTPAMVSAGANMEFDNKCTALYQMIGNVYVNLNEGVEIEADKYIYVYGWYFCNG